MLGRGPRGGHLQTFRRGDKMGLLPTALTSTIHTGLQHNCGRLREAVPGCSPGGLGLFEFVGEHVRCLGSVGVWVCVHGCKVQYGREGHTAVTRGRERTPFRKAETEQHRGVEHGSPGNREGELPPSCRWHPTADLFACVILRRDFNGNL